LADRHPWVGDIATTLLNDVFQRLSTSLCDLLRAFSVYRTPVPIEAAQAVFPTLLQQSLLPELKALLTQQLIQATNEQSFQLHAIVASYVKQHFIKGSNQEIQWALRQAHARAAEYCIQQSHTQHPPREQHKKMCDVFWIVEAVWQSMQAMQ